MFSELLLYPRQNLPQVGPTCAGDLSVQDTLGGAHVLQTVLLFAKGYQSLTAIGF